jgi:cation:H+ antiporter
MLTYALLLLLSLGIILLSCEIFTNGVEWAGKLLKFGDGVVGSLFSAVGTCLPETTIPMISILFSNNMEGSVDVGIGAIVGAPFMLSTIAFFMTGASVALFKNKRKTRISMKVNVSIIKRDIGFFIILYSLGLTATYIKAAYIRHWIAYILAAAYLVYIFITVRNDKHTHGKLKQLYLTGIFGRKPSLGTVLLQICLAFTGIIVGAKLFVGNIEDASHVFGISTLVLSLIVTPIATELPEKFNSIIWIRRNKDTLALSNITGAMVFQSCIPVSVGILATPWQLDVKAAVSAMLALLSALMVYLWIKLKSRLHPAPLLMGGVFYIAFLLYLVKNSLF